MTDDPGRSPLDRQSELDQDQSVVDLDQGIVDREQARVDRDQEPLDAAQEALTERGAAAPESGRTHAERTADLGLQQDRQDAHQAQIDQTQLAQGVRQELIDQQQTELQAPSPGAPDADADLARAAEELQEALYRRAEDSLARAESARRRAAETLQRLEAAQLRERERD